MFEISLFLFFASFFFYMLPTLKRQLYAMQDADYFYEKYIVFMKKQRKVESMWLMMGFMATSLLLQRFLSISAYLIVHAVILGVFILLHRRKPVVNSPHAEPRMTSLCIATGALFLTIFILLGLLFNRTFFWEMPFIIMFLGFMSDTWILLGNWLVMPFEKKRAKRISGEALSKMERLAGERAAAGKKPLVVIGVTGTFGKTGYIQIAKELLSKKYNVLASQPNRLGTVYNAAECIVTSLTAEHDVLLIEIMARHPGDVKRFIQSIPVQMGVITSAAERNLETFLSPERILETLAELSTNMAEGQGGKLPQLILNYDDEQLRKLKLGKRELLRYGVYRGASAPQHLDFWATELGYTVQDSSLTLCDHAGMHQACRVPQSGRFFVSNAIGAAGLCAKLGFSAREIGEGLGKLSAIPGYPAMLVDGAWPDRVCERLAKPWESKGAETREKAPFRILDNSNEASLEGARDTLSLLASFDGYRVLLSQGLRGQGENEDESNRLLGRQAARCCDEIIIIRKEKYLLVDDGAQRSGFSSDHMHLASDLKDGIRRARALVDDQKKPACVLMLGQF